MTQGASLHELMQESGPNTILEPVGIPLLSFLISNRDFRRATNLIEMGANLNLRSPMGYTALKLSIQNGNLELSKHLIRYGAKFYPYDKTNELCCSIYSKRNHLINFVIEQSGAEQLSDSAYFVAAAFGNLEFISNYAGRYRYGADGLMKFLSGSRIKKSTVEMIGMIIK